GSDCIFFGKQSLIAQSNSNISDLRDIFRHFTESQAALRLKITQIRCDFLARFQNTGMGKGPTPNKPAAGPPLAANKPDPQQVIKATAIGSHAGNLRASDQLIKCQRCICPIFPIVAPAPSIVCQTDANFDVEMLAEPDLLSLFCSTVIIIV